MTDDLGDAGDTGTTDGDDGAGGDAGHSNDQGGDGGSANGDAVRDPAAVLAKNEELLAEVKESREKLAKFEADEEARRQAALSENEKAIEAAEAAGYDRAASTFGQQLLQERIFARATGVLQDPSDAIAMIDTTDIELDDADAIDAAIEALVKSKPHLRAVQRRPGINQGPVGDPATGTSGDDWLRGVLHR